MSSSVESALSGLAARQYGLITRDQAVAAGASTDSIDRLCRRGAWVRSAPSVYRVASSGRSWKQDVMVAALSVSEEAVASHHTAARLWQLDDFDPYPIHVATTRPRWRKRDGVVVHRLTDLASPYVTAALPIPMTTPARTILDLAACVPAWRVERVLDAALRRGLTSVEAVEEIVSDLARQGKRGVKVIRELVKARAAWSETTESELEDAFQRLVLRSGLPRPSPQFQVLASGEPIARADFAYPEQKLVIELDGFAFHSDPASFVLDRERQNRLLMAGFRVLRYTARDLRKRPEEVIEELRQALSLPVNRDRA